MGRFKSLRATSSVKVDEGQMQVEEEEKVRRFEELKQQHEQQI